MTGAEFERSLQDHAANGGLMVGDMFVVDSVTYRIEAHDNFGVFHFERLGDEPV